MRQLFKILIKMLIYIFDYFKKKLLKEQLPRQCKEGGISVYLLGNLVFCSRLLNQTILKSFHNIVWYNNLGTIFFHAT